MTKMIQLEDAGGGLQAGRRQGRRGPLRLAIACAAALGVTTIVFAALYADSQRTRSTQASTCDIPDVPTLVRLAFPPPSAGGKWVATDGYWSKQYDGADPSLGGVPTPLDTGYPFEYPAPYLGQPGAGSPHHCPSDAPPNTTISSCPRITASSDAFPLGPGHIPPPAVFHSISVAAQAGEGATWFEDGCRIPPSTLLAVHRRLYPRSRFPDPGSYDADPYVWPYDFPSPQGPPHHCSDEYTATGQWVDFCPYTATGRYIHPHIGLAALQQHLAHKYNPARCGETWDDSNYPMSPDTTIAFPAMEAGAHAPVPALPYQWPGPSGTKRKDVLYPFVLRGVLSISE